MSTNQLSSCLESLTVDDLYPSVTTNGVTISGIGGVGDTDADSIEKKSSTSSNSDFEQVITMTTADFENPYVGFD